MNEGLLLLVTAAIPWVMAFMVWYDDRYGWRDLQREMRRNRLKRIKRGHI
jgi:hypothetical protein